MKKAWMIALLVGVHGFVQADCAAPTFDDFEPFRQQVQQKPQDWMSFRLEPVATLDLPVQSVPWFGVTPSGSLIFKNAEDTFGVAIGFTKSEDLPQVEGVHSAYDFYRKIFESPSDEHCDYLKIYDFDGKSYNFKVDVSGGVVFAYGAGVEHEFIVVSESSKNTVLTGKIKSADVDLIHVILNSIQLRGG